MANNDAKDLGKWLVKVGKQLEDNAKKVVEDVTEKIADESRKIVPVDTGLLQDSIFTYYAMDNLMGIIATNMDYSVYVHEGTWKMYSSPFFSDALDMFIDEFLNRMKNLDKE